MNKKYLEYMVCLFIFGVGSFGLFTPLDIDIDYKISFLFLWLLLGGVIARVGIFKTHPVKTIIPSTERGKTRL